ncbi:ABC transporter permease, partial [Romeria aff. gracilis LEGE 07310]
EEMIAARRESGWRRGMGDSLLLAWRNLLRLSRTPAVVVSVLLFPAIFLSGFLVIGQRLMAAQGVDYIQYLVPIINLQAMFFAGLSSALLLTKDMQTGMMQRCRAMPISRAAVLGGLVLAYLVRGLFATLILLALALVYGFRFQAGLLGLLGYFFLVLLFTAVCIAGYGALALKLRRPALVDAVSIVPYAPLLLLSNGFSPAENFPGWLQPIVRYQPVSVTCDALRSLSSASPELLPVLSSLLWLTAALVGLGAWAIHLYRNLS